MNAGEEPIQSMGSASDLAANAVHYFARNVQKSWTAPRQCSEDRLAMASFQQPRC
jgi:hypothetical protein